MQINSSNYYFHYPHQEGYVRQFIDGECYYLKTEDLRKILLEDMERVSQKHAFSK